MKKTPCYGATLTRIIQAVPFQRMKSPVAEPAGAAGNAAEVALRINTHPFLGEAGNASPVPLKTIIPPVSRSVSSAPTADVVSPATEVLPSMAVARDSKALRILPLISNRNACIVLNAPITY